MSIVGALEVFQAFASVFQCAREPFFIDGFGFADDGPAIWELDFGVICVEAVDNMGPHVLAGGGVWKIGTLSEKGTV